MRQVQIVGERRRRAARDRRAAARPDHPRPEPAGAQRRRGLPHPAAAARRRADMPIIMLTARTSEVGSGGRPGSRRRRLRHQAVQPARAGGAGARGAAPAPGRRARRRRIYQGRAPRRRTSTPWPYRVDGAPVRLTRREFELLRFLVENRNRVLSRDRLLERVWGYDRYIETRSVDVHVGRLRAKLGSGRPADRNRRRAGLPVRRISGDAGRSALAVLAPAAALELGRFAPHLRDGPLDAVPVGVAGTANQAAVLFDPHFPALTALPRR